MAAEREHTTPQELLAALEDELAAGHERIARRRTELHAARGELKNARAMASDLSWELEDLEQRLRDLRAQREGPGDALLDRELASIAARRADLEERVLAQMLLVDDIATHIANEEPALATDERAWAEHEAQLLVERDRLADRLASDEPPDKADSK